jgi:Domain of unknown function (DUF4410)
MRYAKYAAVMAILALTIYGCAGPKAASTPLEAPGQLKSEELRTTERFRKYNSIGLRRFSTEDVIFSSTDTDERPEMEAFAKTANQFLSKGFLREMKKNHYKKYGTVDSDDEVKNYDLIIEGQFTEIDRGNAAARFWGVGGLAMVRITGTMKETSTGKVVAKFSDYNDAGRLGAGSSINLMEDCAEEIGGNLSDFLRDCY